MFYHAKLSGPKDDIGQRRTPLKLRSIYETFVNKTNEIIQNLP